MSKENEINDKKDEKLPLNEGSGCKDGEKKGGERKNTMDGDRNHKRNRKKHIFNGFDRKHSSNDVSWYKTNDQLFDQAAHISQVHINGFPYNVQTRLLKPISDSGYTDSGVMTADLIITPGKTQGSGDPFNQCMINFFNYIRGKYTSSVPFQPNDLGCYFLAVGNIIALYSSIKRSLNCINLFSKENKDLSRLLYASMGYKAQHIAEERSEYATNIIQLNLQLTRLESLALPRNVNFFKRCAWLFSYYYFDDPSALRGNYYMYKLGGYYTFSSTVPTHDQPTLNATGLIYHNMISSDSRYIRTDIEALNNAISDLVNDDNARQISGWLAAYYKDFVFTTEYCSAETLLPAFNEEISHQFRNLKVLPEDIAKVNISQDISTQGLYYPLIFSPTSWDDYQHSAAVYDGWLMRYNTAPSDDDIMTGSRLTYGITQIEGTQVQFETDLVIAVGLEYSHYLPDGNNSINTVEISQASSADDDAYVILNDMAMAMYCACSPILINTIDVSDETNLPIHAGNMVYHRSYTFPIASQDLVKMNRVSILAQFGLPAGNSSNVEPDKR